MMPAGSPLHETTRPGPSFGPPRRTRLVLFANTDWYLYNFRISLAQRAAHHLGADIWVACPDGPYRAALEAAGFHWIPVVMQRRSLNPLHDLATAWRLSKALRAIQPDLLHAFTLKSNYIGTLAAWLADVPRVVNAITGLGTMYSGRKLRYLTARWLLGHFFRIFLMQRRVRIIFQNPEDQGQIEALTGNSAGLRLIAGSGVDTARFHPADGDPVTPMVLMAARLIRDKGIDVLCEAALLVAQEVPEVQFQIAGEVDPGNPTSFTTEDIAALAERHPMVHFLGHRSDMVELFHGATLAVLPAQVREGLPRSLIEACASGLPLVASDVEGVREVVLPGRNGLLVPPGNAQALAAALLELLKDPERRAAMGRESRALALERFDQEKVLKATLAVYSELGLVPACAGTP
jgi:glycosyltransferase involved in cell wall biosynthesis